MKMLSREFILTTMERCLQDMIVKPIDYYLSWHLLHVQDFPQFIPTLLQRNYLKLVLSVIIRGVHLSATDVVQIIKYLISQADRDKLAKYLSLSKRYSRINGDAALEEYMSYMLTFDVPMVVLQREFKGLTPKETVWMLEFLYKWFVRHYEENSEQLLSAHDVVPTPKKILSWMSLVIDTHIAEMILTEDCHKTVLDIKNLTQQQIQICENLESVSGYLQQLTRRMPRDQTKLPREQSSDYWIQVLKF